MENKANNTKAERENNIKSLMVILNYFLKTKIFNYVGIFITFFLALFVYHQLFVSPTTSNQRKQTKTVYVSDNVSNSAQLASEMSSLKTDVQQYRDENYQTAIRRADEAGQKADRVVNYMLAIATIFGIGIASVTFFVGKDIKSILAQMNAHEVSARTKAEFVNKVADQAVEKGKILEKQVKKIQDAIGKIETSKGESSKQLEEIKSFVNDAKGTISDIRGLQQSASLTASASYSYPWQFGSPVPGNASMTNLKHCKKCGSTYFYDPFYPYAGYNPELCVRCNTEK